MKAFTITNVFSVLLGAISLTSLISSVTTVGVVGTSQVILDYYRQFTAIVISPIAFDWWLAPLIQSPTPDWLSDALVIWLLCDAAITRASHVSNWYVAQMRGDEAATKKKPQPIAIRIIQRIARFPAAPFSYLWATYKFLRLSIGLWWITLFELGSMRPGADYARDVAISRSYAARSFMVMASPIFLSVGIFSLSAFSPAPL